MKALLITLSLVLGFTTQATDGLFIKKMKTSSFMNVSNNMSITDVKKQGIFKKVTLSAHVMPDNQTRVCGLRSISKFQTVDKSEGLVKINLYEVFQTVEPDQTTLPDGRIVVIPTACSLSRSHKQYGFSTTVYVKQGEEEKDIVISTENRLYRYKLIQDESGDLSLNYVL